MLLISRERVSWPPPKCFTRGDRPKIIASTRHCTTLRLRVDDGERWRTTRWFAVRPGYTSNANCTRSDRSSDRHGRHVVVMIIILTRAIHVYVFTRYLRSVAQQPTTFGVLVTGLRPKRSRRVAQERRVLVAGGMRESLPWRRATQDMLLSFHRRIIQRTGSVSIWKYYIIIITVEPLFYELSSNKTLCITDFLIMKFTYNPKPSIARKSKFWKLLRQKIIKINNL